MKAYLAAHYERKAELAIYARLLEAEGIEITASWLWMPESQNVNPRSPDRMTSVAVQDYQDILEADTVISFTERAKLGVMRGGRHVEFGMAYVLGKRCILVGVRENIFHWLPKVECCETLDELIEILEEERLLDGKSHSSRSQGSSNRGRRPNRAVRAPA